MTTPPRETPDSETPPVIVTDNPKRRTNRCVNRRTQRAKPDKAKAEPKNVFSDETAKRLLQWIRGTSKLPDRISLEGIAAADSNSSVPHDLQQELAEAIRARCVPWLLSFSLHALVLIALALLFLPLQETNPFAEILSGFNDAVAELDDPPGAEKTNDPEWIVTPQNLPTVEQPLVEPPKTEPVTENGSEFAVETESTATPGLNLQGREFGSHATLLADGGGTGQTDAAVVAGLRWLMQVQQPDGSWCFSRGYPHAADRSRENRLAATAMALLAFQGYGVTPHSTRPELVEFTKTVQLGWAWLLPQQQFAADDRDLGDGVFFREGVLRNDDRFYTHGLCTMALCEVLAMTEDDSVLQEQQYILRHQSISGGWRYNADRHNPQSDVSVTGWMVMALKSAEAAGIAVPQNCYDNVMRFLDSVATDGGSQYLYRPEEPGFRIAITAEGLLCRELLGWKRDDPRLKRGVDLLVDPQYLPSFEDHYSRDAYHWYYATQALHHYGDEPWKIWNEKMRELLPLHQEQRGANAGSWNPQQPVRDTWGTQYGRLYTTCLSIYILEVYYRHLSVYAR